MAQQQRGQQKKESARLLLDVASRKKRQAETMEELRKENAVLRNEIALLRQRVQVAEDRHKKFVEMVTCQQQHEQQAVQLTAGGGGGDNHQQQQSSAVLSSKRRNSQRQQQLPRVREETGGDTKRAKKVSADERAPWASRSFVIDAGPLPEATSGPNARRTPSRSISFCHANTTRPRAVERRATFTTTSVWNNDRTRDDDFPEDEQPRVLMSTSSSELLLVFGECCDDVPAAAEILSRQQAPSTHLGNGKIRRRQTIAAAAAAFPAATRDKTTNKSMVGAARTDGKNNPHQPAANSSSTAGNCKLRRSVSFTTAYTRSMTTPSTTIPNRGAPKKPIVTKKATAGTPAAAAAPSTATVGSAVKTRHSSSGNNKTNAHACKSFIPVLKRSQQQQQPAAKRADVECRDVQNSSSTINPSNPGVNSKIPRPSAESQRTIERCYSTPTGNLPTAASSSATAEKYRRSTVHAPLTRQPAAQQRLSLQLPPSEHRADADGCHRRGEQQFVDALTSPSPSDCSTTNSSSLSSLARYYQPVISGTVSRAASHDVDGSSSLSSGDGGARHPDGASDTCCCEGGSSSGFNSLEDDGAYSSGNDNNRLSSDEKIEVKNKKPLSRLLPKIPVEHANVERHLGPASPDLKNSDLPPPKDFQVTRFVGNDSVLLAWEPPVDDRVAGYNIFVNGEFNSRVRSSHRTKALVTGVNQLQTPSSWVVFEIYSTAADGGPPSSPAAVRIQSPADGSSPALIKSTVSAA